MKLNIHKWEIQSPKIKYLLAILHAVFVLFLCYLLGNIPYSLGDEEQYIQRLHIVKEYISSSQTVLPTTLLPINVAYDKQLIEWTDEYGLPVGKQVITDREKLLRFLQIARETNNYRYIMLDVVFEPDVHTDIDSLLFATIANTDRLVIPRHKDDELTDSLLLSKLAYADYRTSINEGNFVKYQYINNDMVSMAWKMYADCTGMEYSHWGPFYFSNGRLCNSCLFLNFTVMPGEGSYTPNGEKIFYNIGIDILDQAKNIDYSTFLRNKVIIIGDLTENDIHDTYAGPMSGSYINYNAFLALMDGKHYVDWPSMTVLFIIYFFISLFLLSNKSLFDSLSLLKSIKSRTWRTVFSFVGFTGLLSIVCAAFYLINGYIFDILTISGYFSLCSLILNTCRTIKLKKE